MKPDLALQIIVQLLNRLTLSQAEAFAVNEALKVLTPPPEITKAPD
jgi:hypothetical protein